MSVLEQVQKYREELEAIRHDIHAHPELGFEEVRTSEIVARYLSALGLEVYSGLGKTGVVGVLRGQPTSNRVIGLRAEMDALPIQEASDLRFKSTIPGVFHGCGHDGHTTMLLGAARCLAETWDGDGSVVFIFQPAEEGLGGARAMLKDGLFEKFPCDEIYAIHNAPTGPAGQVLVCPGPAMAAADFFDIHIKGRGAHAAMPDDSADPIAAATAISQSLQTIASRNVDPQKPFVLSVTKFNAGAAYNVIPGSAELGGTVRTFDPAVRELARRRISEIAEGHAHAFGVSIEVEIRDLFSILRNDEACATAAGDAAAEIYGEDKVSRRAAPQMASEDFAEMLERVPGAYMWLAQKAGPGLHNPAFEFDDEIIPVGAALLANIAIRRLGTNDRSNTAELHQ